MVFIVIVTVNQGVLDHKEQQYIYICSYTLMIRSFVRRFCSKPVSMVRVLNVAEKNDAAKSLAELMSRGRYRKREGFSRFNKIYEYEFNILNQQNVTMTMTSVSGHLLGLEFTGQHRKWYGCNPVALFDAPVQKMCPQDYNDIKRTLEREVRGCQSLIIWTDGDREGENIGFEIIQVCKAVKANLRVYRARFSEITPGAIQRACANLREPDKNTSDAVDVRQELDLRIGAAFTRFQTMRLQKVFPAVLAEQLISYGSCQFPTLGFVVERYKQVQAFIPEPFWKIAVQHETDEGNVDFNWKRVRLFNHTACLVLYQHCLENSEATVVEVKSKPKSKWRPLALDTVELEKLASRKLRINAKETMKIAEKLYTQGYISYPRTETNMFPADFDLVNLIEQQTQDQRWGAFAGGILEHGPNPRNGNKSDKAHPPIHPLKYTNNLQGNEGRVYEFVVRHFLACCSQDAQGKETTVEINIADETFTATGLMIFARNYLDVYPYDKWNAKVIPQFEQGQVFQPKTIEMNQGETSPPSLLTESDLIALMDKHGIGTDATHADHIEKIKSRLYVGVGQDSKFVPGELGMGLVEGYDAMGYEMSKPNLRAELEADLKLICEGQKDSNGVLLQQIEKYKQVFIEAVRQADKIDTALSEYFGNAEPYRAQGYEEQVAVQKCVQCGQDMMLKTKKDGKGFFISCMGYPNCRSAIWFPDAVLEASVDDATCTMCAGHPHKIKFKLKRGSVPPYIPLEFVGCIGCDQELQEALNVRLPSARPQTGTGQSSSRSHDSGYGSSINSSNNNSSRGGQNGSQSRTFSTQSSTRTPLGTQMNRPNLLTNGQGGSRAPRPVVPNGASAASQGSTIVCNCGEDAKLLTVRKEGPNTGRTFYVCPRPQDSKCSFFLWADENQDSSGTEYGGGGGGGGGGGQGIDCAAGFGRGQTGSFGSSRTYNNRQPQRQSWGGASGGGSSDDDVQCRCGQPAKQLKVVKEGPNKGKPFFACPKPRGEGCNFFQWQEEMDAGAGSAGISGRGHGRGGGTTVQKRAAPNNQAPGTKKKMTCSNCKQPGHRKNKCPMPPS